MKQKLTFKENLFIGSMLFGLFFGAGNLIFPLHLGQMAGANVLLANLGFLITAIGLPFLGIIAIGISKTNGVFAISSRVSKIYAYILRLVFILFLDPSLLYQDLQQHHMKLLFHHLFLQAVENGFYLSLVCCSLS